MFVYGVIVGYQIAIVIHLECIEHCANTRECIQRGMGIDNRGELKEMCECVWKDISTGHVTTKVCDEKKYGHGTACVCKCFSKFAFATALQCQY